MDEEQALNSFKRGNRKAFEYFYDKYKSAIHVYALRIMDNVAVEAQDVVVSALNKLYEHRKEIQSPVHLRNFLYRVARNDAYTIRARLKKRGEVEKKYGENVVGEGGLAGFDHDMVIAEMFRIVNSAVSFMPDSTQMIFKLNYEEKKPLTEVARMLGRDYHSVYRERGEALKKLKTMLFNSGYDKPAIVLIMYLLSQYN